jgi:hypothetical protein
MAKPKRNSRYKIYQKMLFIFEIFFVDFSENGNWKNIFLEVTKMGPFSYK